MSKLEQQFVLSVDGEVAIRLCREVSADFGWRVLESSSQSISIKEVAPQSTSFTWPARIDIKIRSSSKSQCSIQLNGSVAGMGPIQRNHLQGQMGRFLNALSILAEKKKAEQEVESVPVATNPSTSLSEELFKLHELFEKGILSESEFTAAKTRLIGS
jgi:hypothetical protein